MERRRYLAVLAAGGAFGGCTDDGQDLESETNDSEVRREALGEALVREDIEVEELAVDDGRVELVYSPPDLPEDADEADYEARVEETIETTARAFYRRVRGGWEVSGLDATVRIEGSTVATWRMESEWVEQHRAGDITREELREKIEATVERHYDTPA